MIRFVPTMLPKLVKKIRRTLIMSATIPGTQQPDYK